MLEVAIMLDGQNGLTWPRWKNIVRLVEEASNSKYETGLRIVLL